MGLGMGLKLDMRLIDPEQYLPAAYEEARAKGMIRHADIFGHSFTYAMLSLADQYTTTIEMMIEEFSNSLQAGRQSEDKLFVLIDNIPKNLWDVIGLHEHLKNRVRFVNGRRVKSDDKHFYACRDELSLLQSDPRLFASYARFWVNINWLHGAERWEEEGKHYYFGTLMPDLEDLIQLHGRHSPEEILSLYQQRLEKAYRAASPVCGCTPAAQAINFK